MRRLAVLIRALWQEIRHPRRGAPHRCYRDICDAKAPRIRKIAPGPLTLLLAALVLPGCALHGGPRHTATVSIVSTHAVLKAIDDTEMQIVCGRVGAPQAPLCVPISQHRIISAYLKDAFELEAQIGRVLVTIPDGQLLPEHVMSLTVQVGALINKIIELLPNGKSKAALMQRIGPEGFR